MIKRFFLILLFAFAASGVAQSQDTVQELGHIREALSQGDVKSLMRLSAGTVELALFSASRQYTSSQATLVLKRFFREYPPTGFDIVESSRSATGIFVEGKLRTSNNASSLRTYFRLNKANEGWKLRELLIESPER